MRYRQIIDGEPQYGQNRQNFLEGINASQQVIQTRLKLFTNEWWEDLTDGLPLWTQMIGYAGSNKDKSNALIQARIMSTVLNGANLFTSITNIRNTYNPQMRKYSFTATVKSVYGYIIVTNGEG